MFKDFMNFVLDNWLNIIVPLLILVVLNLSFDPIQEHQRKKINELEKRVAELEKKVRSFKEENKN